MATKKVHRNNKSSQAAHSKGLLGYVGQCFNRYPKLSGLIVLIVLVTILDILTPYGGQLRFYAKWIECGGRPYATAGLIWNTAGVSHYEPSPTFMIDRGGNNPYFCTPREAELAGFSASEHQYSFPNLSQDEVRAMWNRHE